MRELTKIDKILLILGFLIVIGIFILAFVLYFKGGTCALNPCEYANSKNISCFRIVGLE